MSLSEQQINDIIKQVTDTLGGSGKSPEQAGSSKPQVNYSSVAGPLGVYAKMDDAISNAKASQKKLAALSIEMRGKIVSAMREAALKNAQKLAVSANEETGFGRVEHKMAKNILAAEKTPGIEDVNTYAFTGDYGLTLVEGAPFGVIGSITPSTNPAATVINNGIGMIAGGNAVVFNPHPGAKNVTIEAIKILNTAIFKVCGIDSLLCTVEQPTIETSNELMKHKDVRLLVVTGGEAVVAVAMKSGKKVIGAGPGNPPVIVDDTVDLKKTARDIVDGASFDNNILCTDEKEVFAFKNIADKLVDEMVNAGAYLLNDSEIEKVLAITILTGENGKKSTNKKYVGKNALYILKDAGIVPDNKDIRLIIAKTNADHPFVTVEMLMPVLPIVKVNDLDDAIEKSIIAENNCHHTALMHSQNVTSLTKAARALDTTIFVKNAPSYAGLGYKGEGYATLTIATPTGEGLTSAKDFVRWRRCTLSGSFKII